MNEIEEKLWNYIDGTCSTEEQQAIDLLINTNQAYKQKYAELLQLNRDFATMELDEPSMAFSYNVMQAVQTEMKLKPLKSAINKRVIWGISAFFVVTISALVIWALSSVNWHWGGNSSNTVSNFKMPPVQNLFTGNVLKGFVMFDMVLGLYLLDAYLRKKLNNKQAE